MAEIATSLLDVPEDKIVSTIYQLEVAKTDYFHIDVMDGEFVPHNTTQKMTTYCEYLKNITTLPLDVHLMVKDIPSYIESFSLFSPNILTIHYEACSSLEECKHYLQQIQEKGCRAGIAIKPTTDVSAILELLPYLHLVLVMSVEPGKGGQTFMPSALNKIQTLSTLRENQQGDWCIEVDGGIHAENAPAILQAGADILVAGNYIIHSANFAKAIGQLKQEN